MAAKRYLCAVEPAYHGGLSAGSVAQPAPPGRADGGRRGRRVRGDRPGRRGRRRPAPLGRRRQGRRPRRARRSPPTSPCCGRSHAEGRHAQHLEPVAATGGPGGGRSWRCSGGARPTWCACRRWWPASGATRPSGWPANWAAGRSPTRARRSAGGRPVRQRRPQPPADRGDDPAPICPYVADDHEVPRLVLHARTGGVDVFSTHLAWQLHDAALRERQVRALVDFVAECSDPAAAVGPVVAADLNAEPDSTVVRYLCGLATLDGHEHLPAGRLAPGGRRRPRDHLVERQPPRRPRRRGRQAHRLRPQRVPRPRARRPAGRVPGGRRRPVDGVWPSDHSGVLAVLADHRGLTGGPDDPSSLRTCSAPARGEGACHSRHRPAGSGTGPWPRWVSSVAGRSTRCSAATGARAGSSRCCPPGRAVPRAAAQRAGLPVHRRGRLIVNDLANLVTPTPDVVGEIGEAFDEGPGAATPESGDEADPVQPRWPGWRLGLVVPGMVLIVASGCACAACSCGRERGRRGWPPGPGRRTRATSRSASSSTWSRRWRWPPASCRRGCSSSTRTTPTRRWRAARPRRNASSCPAACSPGWAGGRPAASSPTCWRSSSSATCGPRWSSPPRSRPSTWSAPCWPPRSAAGPAGPCGGCSAWRCGAGPACGDGVEEHFVAEELTYVAQLGALDDDNPTGTLATLVTFPFMVANVAYTLVRLIFGGFVVAPIMAALWRRRRLLADADGGRADPRPRQPRPGPGQPAPQRCGAAPRPVDPPVRHRPGGRPGSGRWTSSPASGTRSGAATAAPASPGGSALRRGCGRPTPRSSELQGEMQGEDASLDEKARRRREPTELASFLPAPASGSTAWRRWAPTSPTTRPRAWTAPPARRSGTGRAAGWVVGDPAAGDHGRAVRRCSAAWRSSTWPCCSRRCCWPRSRRVVDAPCAEPDLRRPPGQVGRRRRRWSALGLAERKAQRPVEAPPPRGDGRGGTAARPGWRATSG